MRTFAYLATLSWHMDGGVHAHTDSGTYEAEAFETMAEIRDAVLEEARLSLGVPYRTPYAVIMFWLDRNEDPAE